MEELADTEDLDRTRIVIVGDSLVGKSSMLNAFLTRNELTIITRERKPTNVHTFDVRGTIDGVRHHMLLVEIGDDDANEKDRPRIYSTAHVFIVAFAIHEKATFKNVISKWVPQVREHQPDARFFLVGLQSDRRNATELLASDLELIEITEFKEGLNLAKKIKAFQYMECSTQIIATVNQIFSSALQVRQMKKPAIKSKTCTMY
ncbi:rho-related protein racD-like isoform X1 [Clavelina lepadiformis]|uniref:rho-related protein racD-like isoform X1 n=1 Tax=Clavelina lepadiformis TaxID=159417 RepID=UPI0040412DF3